MRADFPERNDAEWLTNLAVRRERGQLVLEKRWFGQGWVDQPGDIRIKPWG